MQFPKSLHADGWHAHMPDQRPLPPIPVVTHDSGDDQERGSHHHRYLHVLGIALVAVAALVASARLDVGRDPRSLDEQLSSAMHGASGTLQQWQRQLSHGLQVSLRAVADGNSTPDDAKPEANKTSEPATLVAQAEPAATDPTDRQQPVRADLAPRQTLRR